MYFQRENISKKFFSKNVVIFLIQRENDRGKMVLNCNKVEILVLR